MYRKAEMRRRSTAETEAAMEAARLHSRLEKIETELQLAKDRLAIAETDGKSLLVIYIKNYSIQEIPFFNTWTYGNRS